MGSFGQKRVREISGTPCRITSWSMPLGRRPSVNWPQQREEPEMNFNLLDERWIPVLYRDGRGERVGIRKAFEDAGSIRQTAAANPMDRV